MFNTEELKEIVDNAVKEALLELKTTQNINLEIECDIKNGDKSSDSDYINRISSDKLTKIDTQRRNKLKALAKDFM
jgi:hypothetical protein